MDKAQILNVHLEKIAENISRARIHFAIWKIYKVERERYHYILNKHVGFFRPSISAHFTALILAISKLGDTTKGTYNISRLLKMLEKQDIEFDKQRYNNDISPILERLSKLRHEVFAHSSIEFDSAAAFKKAGTSIQEIETLLNVLQEWFGRIYHSITGDVHTFPNMDAENYTRRMLESLITQDKNEA